ncbi:MAG: hypothetical protein JW832_05985 [Deltaproteobacteria bacterium]|nr:hypothetical protein [Deltaproteobacteria bacterium]
MKLSAIPCMLNTSAMIPPICFIMFCLIGCKPPCPVLEHCGEYFQYNEKGAYSNCTDLYGVKACNGEKSCADVISAAAQLVESCQDVDEEWFATCEWTNTEFCGHEVQYSSYGVDCDADCREQARETGQFSCEGAGGIWTLL